MEAQYDKVIVIKNQRGEKQAVIIFDEHLHQPTYFGLEKLGMDDILELIKKSGNSPLVPAGGVDNKLNRPVGGGKE